MNKILTISIAAYNVSDTIEKCLDSFLDSDYFSLLDIVVVNDGSIDNTVDIVKKYILKYPHVIRLINKENGGHGSTINAAFEKAKGKFFKVIDGDDWVDVNELDKLIKKISESSADLIVSRFNKVYSDHVVEQRWLGDYEIGREYKFDELNRHTFTDAGIFPMHATTIRTEQLKSVDMHIREKCFYADTEFLFFVGLAAKSVEFDESVVYQYRLGESGQSVSPEGIYKHIEDLIEIELGLIKLYNDRIDDVDSLTRKKYLYAIIDTRFSLIIEWFIKVIDRSDKDYALFGFINIMKTKYSDYYYDFRKKLLVRIFLIGPVFSLKVLRRFYHSRIKYFIKDKVMNVL